LHAILADRRSTTGRADGTMLLSVCLSSVRYVLWLNAGKRYILQEKVVCAIFVCQQFLSRHR